MPGLPETLFLKRLVPPSRFQLFVAGSLFAIRRSRSTVHCLPSTGEALSTVLRPRRPIPVAAGILPAVAPGILPGGVPPPSTVHCPLPSLPVTFRLFEKRMCWRPTWLGWLCLSLPLLALPATWVAYGESFLCLNRRLPADVLVVEGWISSEGIRQAKAEFERGGYAWVVAAGTMSGEDWEDRRWSYAEIAQSELARLGVPKDHILLAFAGDSPTQRTRQSALAALSALQSAGLRPKTINVFTRGPHARRSRSVYAKVFRPTTRVGVISWTPRGQNNGPWWTSTFRTKEFLTETAGWFFDLLSS